MAKSKFITCPKDAFDQAEAMAKSLGLSLVLFCKAADVPSSSVYRWKTNEKSYNCVSFAKLRLYYQEQKARKTKK